MNSDIDKEHLDQEVLFQLGMHHGEQNPIGRWELVEKVYGREACEPRSDENHWDRLIRASVERLRKAGHLICELFDGRGRFLASTAKEYWTFRMRYGSRAFEIMQTLREMDAAAGRTFGEVITSMRRNGPEVAGEFPETLYQPKLI